MCLAFPGKILSISDDGMAEVDFDGVKKSVNVSLIDSPKASDYVIVHAGFAIQKMGTEDAFEVLKLFKEAQND